jgi:hypothetical protein
MMVRNTQNYWISGLCSLSGILNTRKYNVLETVFLSSGDGRKTLAQLGPLEGANLNHWTIHHHHHHYHYLVVKFHRSVQGYKVCLTDIEPVIDKCYTENIQ